MKGALDLAEAEARAAQLMALLAPMSSKHVVRQRDVIALSDGTLALVFDPVNGSTLAQVLGSRGQLTAGETVTTVAPMFGALGDLHAAGIVHGDLGPGTLVFSAEGRPMINELGVAAMLGWHVHPADRAPGFVAPEVLAGASPTPASDVYAAAALGWFCLTGAPPAAGARRPSLASLRPGTPPHLAEVLTSCLATDESARPSAAAAAIDVFDAAPAEPVAQISVADPATEITRRIRALAVPAPEPASGRDRLRRLRRLRRPLVIGCAALLLAMVTGGGATWFLGRSSVAPTAQVAQTVKAGSTARVPATTARVVPDVMTAPASPRVAATALLQALVDARALAYGSRNPALLDLVYAPGAARAGVDRANIATALSRGATYLGLSFVVREVAFIDGTATTARIRASIATPAYATGQPDGRKVSHAKEVLGPSVFSVSLTGDGWRIRALTDS